jgi:acetyl esterase
MSSELSDEAQELMDGIVGANRPPKASIPVDEGRRLLKQSILDHASSAAVDSVQDVEILGPDQPIPVRIYHPGGEEPLPVIVYYHGGGWVRGDIETHDPMCTHLANAADCIVVSVDYRRPPEQPFPAPVEDCYAAAKWAVDNAEPIGGDPEKVVVGGDSAGGNLAAAVALLARERESPAIQYQLLIYPTVNDTANRRFDSYEEHDGYGDTMAGHEQSIVDYIRSDMDRHNPFVFPLRADDLSDLPPAMVLSCEFDILRDEGQAYADRLRDAGVPVDDLFYDDMFHPFLCFPQLDRAQEAYDDIAVHLADALED